MRADDHSPISRAPVALLWIAITIFGAVPGIARQSVTSGTTQIVLLGTGTPNADPDRSGPSIAIVVNDTPYLIDFGPGVVRRAAAAHTAGVAGLAVKNLSKAFVTHLHSDHTAGYPDLILSPWVLERVQPLEVYGPEGLRAMTQHVEAAYQEDIHMRLFGLEPANSTGYKVTVHEVGPGVVYQDDNVTVEAFLVDHGSWPVAFGYRFQTPEKTIVISGDTAPTETVVEMCNGCDVLLHEVYYERGFKQRTPDWRLYHSRNHTSTRELADIATRARPALLILYHQLYMETGSDALLIQEMRDFYDGVFVNGKDLDVF